MKKRIIAISLFISLLLSSVSIVSCAKSNNTDLSDTEQESTQNTSDTSEAEPETETDILLEMGEQDFGGETFTILTFVENDYMHNYVDKQELTGEVINDAVYYRNTKLEEKYNFQINMIENDGMADLVKKAVSAGDKTYDIFYMRIDAAPSLMTGGYLTNLRNVENLSLDSEWWLQNSVKSLSIDNRLYYANSYANMAFSDLCWTLFFNKAYVADYGLENPYELVSSGNWTFDKFEEMMTAVTRDVDGDGAIDSAQDVYGIMTHTGTVNGLFMASGMQLVEKDSNDIPYLTGFSSDNEKLFEILTRIGRIYNSDNFGPLDIKVNNGWADIFYIGNSMFFGECLGYYPTLREQDIEIGLLPFPKYEASQSEYFNYLISPSVVCIPLVVNDIERSGFILEAMSRESYAGGLYDAYFETTLGTKLINDAESKEILKIIIDSCSYDLGQIYGVSSILNNLGSNNGKLSSDKYENIASAMAKLEKSQTKTLEKTIESVKELP